MKYRAVSRIVSFCLSTALILTSVFSVSAVSDTEKISNSHLSDISSNGKENGDLDYYDYKTSHSAIAYANAGAELKIEKNVSAEHPVSLSLNATEDGLYFIKIKYKAIDVGTAEMEMSLSVDGSYPFNEAKQIVLPRMWVDDDKKREDGMGNELPNKLVAYDNTYVYTLTDTLKTGECILFYLTEGTHSFNIVPVSGEFYLDTFYLSAPEQLAAYKAPTEDNIYNGETIIIEGETAQFKNSYSLVGKSDNSSAHITPHDAKLQKINYIGGSNWASPGDTLTWETPKLKAGYYRLGFSFRQNTVLNGVTYRKLTIDGKTPFKEAGEIPFEYDYKWQQKYFSDENNDPYLIYLSEGKHTIGLSVVAGEIGSVTRLLTDAVALLGDIYLDINMITGETIDTYRDYELFAQITDLEQRLDNAADILQEADKMLCEATGHDSGSNSSVIKGMLRAVELMLDNKHIAHRYVSDYYSNYCSVAATLQDINSMPLDLDKMVLVSADTEELFDDVNAFEQAGFSIKRFFISFVQDYNSISGNSGNDKQITVWVNWGRDQAQILNSLVSTTFSENTGIHVNIKIVNATMVQAVLSGKGPDCTLQHGRTEPVNLAMRGVLYDLKNFDDLPEVLNRFQQGAETAYYYKGGLYALPDTQSFPVMYYREDILKELGLSVPKTWNDFENICIELARNNLTAWLPVATNTDMGSVFPSLLMQSGLDLYQEDGKRTNLSTPELAEVFSKWTDYYTKLKMPISISFYNRFRTGTCPIGIDLYTLYTTLKAAAPEIDGLWNIAQIPGTVKEDGMISHTAVGSGTGCAILKQSEQKESAWEFLKWWTSEETQLSYTNELESVLGPAGRVAVSNIEALKKLSWDSNMLDTIMESWNNVQELPEYPGSYYVSRSVYQSYWNVVNKNQNAIDVLTKYSKEADDEMERKWDQYASRNY